MSEATPDRPPEQPAAHPKHLARDRFGKGALNTAHNITRGLAEAGVDDDGVVVLRTGGPRPGLADLERLIDEVLDDEADARTDAPEDGGDDEPGAR